MVYNSCIATMRVFGIDMKINEEEIEKFLNEYFCLTSKVGKEELIAWSAKSQEVLMFFNLIKQEIPHKFEDYPTLKLSGYTKPARKRCTFKPPFFDLYRKELV